ncbi:ankyrin repeat domain-containing protein 33B isoform X2 [Tribolium castaneum]|uniref:ankyrin repeat domain-containing protein 33B isoform X2 n=1 Tax=Tribolium castaneum TaxID=7070 RepID=UPI0000D55A86|nr:PREDICTED: ankyrin repeat domain-containing protein 33B-like isoform X2 [Tribolium castaneum]XP_015833413.1 PREDICTED: ankyrin repeat domain-containing protein 33B-like isoform X2 [Tribolium castaneum]XP_015833414.1 PREDICTED: ankyrin repeat domain-containing protein 33B-like isoform X2 [Tribolium castaneum]|eukprot:XP_015833412.1 PREDICTED: ankyrin repeat domain-containing protein 33B-like isoform X2 [Tribolium castaneum]
MVVSRNTVLRPCIKESGVHQQTLRPVTKRVSELPSLRYGTVGAKAASTGPLRVASVTGKKKEARNSNEGKTCRTARRVRFALPPTDVSPCVGGGGVVSPPVAGDGWLRTRAPFSKRSDAHRSESVGVYASDAVVDSRRAVPVTASPGVRNRVHPTGRYIRGTLSPTANASPHAAASPEGQALLRAARDADDHLLRDLLRRAALVGIAESDLNAGDSSGRTALSYIASNGSIDLLEQILQLPSLDPNKPDNEGNTPLHFAAQAGQVECLNCLLSRRGIEIDARNNLGFTALMKAALQGRNKCAKLLLFAGANPTLRDNGRGFRADQWARFCGRYVCADVIEKHARQRLLERSTSYGNWGGENELGARVLMGKVVPVPPIPQQSSNGLKSKLKKVFRTSSGTGRHEDSYSSARLVTQLTSAALCASSPVLPSAPTVPPVVKSLIRPLTVPKLQITLVNNNGDYPNNNLTNGVAKPPPDSKTPIIKPARTKKKK